MAGQTTLNDRSMIQPNWAAEPIDDRNIIPGGARIDHGGFPFSDGFTVIALGATAAGQNVSIAVSPLRKSIPGGTVLDFGGGKLATLTMTAPDAAGSIRANLAAALTGNETANFVGVSGKKIIRAGTLVGRTWAERDAGAPFGRADVADEEVYLLAFDVENAVETPDCELLRPGAMVRDHLLPDWTALNAGLRSRVRQLYVCLRAASTV